MPGPIGQNRPSLNLGSVDASLKPQVESLVQKLGTLTAEQRTAINNALQGDMAGLAGLVKNPAAAPALKELLGVLAGKAGGTGYAVLEKNNPRFGALLASVKGLAPFLKANSVAGEKAAGEVDTAINWSIWTHSAETNKKYGHGMKDEQILSDLIITMQPSKDPNARVSFGYRTFKGYEIIGVNQTGDHVRKNVAIDGGHLGSFNITAHGKPGEQAIVAWSIVSLADDGRVRGGGYPTTRGDTIIPYQDQKAGGSSGGGEYWGRAARITHGQRGYVPITEN